VPECPLYNTFRPPSRKTTLRHPHTTTNHLFNDACDESGRNRFTALADLPNMSVQLLLDRLSLDIRCGSRDKHVIMETLMRKYVR
jgi:hypothetical protein